MAVVDQRGVTMSVYDADGNIVNEEIIFNE